jgi:hypothetical protein
MQLIFVDTGSLAMMRPALHKPPAIRPWFQQSMFVSFAVLRTLLYLSLLALRPQSFVVDAMLQVYRSVDCLSTSFAQAF